MNTDDLKALQREILLGFWKCPILHHGSEVPVVGQWMLRELRRHGCEASPGTPTPCSQGWRSAAGSSVEPIPAAV